MLFEKNQYNAFRLTNDGFVYKDSAHQFAEIVSLFFSRVITTQRMNFAKVGEAESAELHITLSSGKTIRLSFDEAGLLMGFNSNKKQDINNLIELYAFLARTTFATRLEPYLKQIKANGYFVYDKCTFYPRDKIVYRQREFPISSSQFLKSYGYIELRPKNYGLLNKVLREVSFANPPQFNTQTNTDVIFYLLEEYFGLTWKG